MFNRIIGKKTSIKSPVIIHGYGKLYFTTKQREAVFVSVSAESTVRNLDS
jgi:hypothetical protein